VSNEKNSFIGVDQFSTIDGVMSLFQKVNCIGTNNCFLVALNRNYVPNFNGGGLNNPISNSVANHVNSVYEKLKML